MAWIGAQGTLSHPRPPGHTDPLPIPVALLPCCLVRIKRAIVQGVRGTGCASTGTRLSTRVTMTASQRTRKGPKEQREADPGWQRSGSVASGFNVPREPGLGNQRNKGKSTSSQNQRQSQRQLSPLAQRLLVCWGVALVHFIGSGKCREAMLADAGVATRN